MADATTEALKGGNVPDSFRYRQIQYFINQMPWKELEKPAISLVITEKYDSPTQNALNTLEQIGKELKSNLLIEAVKEIIAGNLKSGTDKLFDAKTEISKLVDDDKKYWEQAGQKTWSLQEKLQYLNSTQYPQYFPRPWQARNVGVYVGGSKHGQFVCGPWLPYEQFRTCQTPYYNNFLLWGPQCPTCGVAGPDPRFSKIKYKYPEAFTYEKVKARLKEGSVSPFVPSPGVAPFVSPPKGSYYKDPRNPNPEVEGIRFYDKEDEEEYYRYLHLYNKFKEQELKTADTVKYNEQFLKQYSDKVKK